MYMRHWGLMHPVFGEGMGVVFGFALGGVVEQPRDGPVLLVLLPRDGLSPGDDFPRAFRPRHHQEVDHLRREADRRQHAVGGSWGLLPVIMSRCCPNFFELNEIWLLTFTLTYPLLETGAYIFVTLMSSMSESYSQAKMALTQRYLDQSLRWGIMMSTMLGGAFIAFSDIFITGPAAAAVRARRDRDGPDAYVARGRLLHAAAGPGFSGRRQNRHLHLDRAARARQPRHPSLGTFCNGTASRASSTRFIMSSILRSIVAWPLMGYLVAWPSLSIWQTLINPALAAVGNYVILARSRSRYGRARATPAADGWSCC